MAEEFMMPKLGLTMEAGTIVNWLVEDGATVEAGQAVLIIETDKVESEVEATRAGRFYPTGQVGEEYACGAHIGWFLEPGESPPQTNGGAGASRPAPAVAATAAPARAGATATPATAKAATGVGGRLLASPNARRIAAARGVDLGAVTGTGPGGRITSEDVPEAPVTVDDGPTGPSPVPVAGQPAAMEAGTLATAAARNLAELLGVDIRTIASAGTDPRVTKEDVAAHVRDLLRSAAGVTAGPTPGATEPTLRPPLQTPASVVPLRGMRGTIAARMSESLHSMAQLTLTMDVDMDAVVADRARRTAEAGDGPVPGYTDYVIAAVAAALVAHPIVNSQVTEDGVALLPQVNVGMAVALDDGLIVPVIADTPALDLDTLAAETSRLATAARAGGLTLPELEGGTFSVTALGMFGVDGFTPIINAPNTAILGVGRLRDDVAWSDDGQPIRTSRLTLSLTWDHRAFDGAPAAAFTQTVKAELEGYR